MNEETIAVPEAPHTIDAPPSIEDIRNMIEEMNLATSQDLQAIAQRLERVEQVIETLPSVYASAETVNKVKTSQEEYEARSRQLTEQVAGLTLITADSQSKFATIETRLNELSAMKDLLTAFMDTQKERIDNQQARLDNADQSISILKAEQAQDIKELRNVREHVSELDSDVNGLRGDLGASVRPMQDTVRDVKTRQDTHDARLLSAEKTLIKLDTSFGSLLWFFNNPDGRKLGGVLLGIFFFTQAAALYLLYRIALAGTLAG